MEYVSGRNFCNEVQVFFFNLYVCVCACVCAWVGVCVGGGACVCVFFTDLVVILLIFCTYFNSISCYD